MANKTITAIVAVAVVAVVIIAGVFVLNKGDDDKARDLAKGDTLEYTVFGSIDTEIGYDDIVGTMKISILDENETQFQVKTEKSIYRISPDKTRTPLDVISTTIWKDKTADLGDMTKNGSVDADTIWGEMRTDLYQNEDKTLSILWNDKLLILVQDETVEGRTIFYELIDTSLDLGKKVEKKDVQVELPFDVSGTFTTSGIEGTIKGTIEMTMDNEYSDIISGGPFVTDVTMIFPNIGEFPLKEKQVQWSTPFENKSSGVKQTETAKIETIWGILETDVYVEYEDGTTNTTYVYDGVPIKLSMDQVTEGSDEKMHMDVTINKVILNGESVTPDDIKH